MAVNDGPRGDLATWVSYLREMGVRDLRVPAPQRPAKKKPGPAAGVRSAPPPAELRETLTSARRQAKQQPSLLASDQPFPAERHPDPAARLVEIREELGDCKRCKLHQGRTKLVFGVGSPQARLMFVGEGPGENEDLEGEPFVGRAGKKLDEMIVAVGLSRAEVYIANIVKCRPPNNRDPERDEVETCSPFLDKQIEAIRPRVLVTLGGPATKTLLRTTTGITKLRGNWHEFRGIPVMPTFHPAFVLRNYTVQTRRSVWNDLQAAAKRAAED